MCFFNSTLGQIGLAILESILAALIFGFVQNWNRHRLYKENPEQFNNKTVDIYYKHNLSKIKREATYEVRKNVI